MPSKTLQKTNSILTCTSLFLFFAMSLSHAEPVPPSVRYSLANISSQARLALAAIDRTKALEEDRKAPRFAPLRYAVTRSLLEPSDLAKSKATQGEWTKLSDGRWLWRLEIQVPNALSLDIGFSKFFLPHGAELFVVGKNETLGPYTDNNNPRQSELWLPLTQGDSARLELTVPEKVREFVALEIKGVNAGYRSILQPGGLAKSGTCHVDVACSLGDSWRDEINAAALITFAGYVCSSQLVNNFRFDRTPFLLTAHHCLSTQAEANTLVAYWKYENPVCREVNTPANGIPYSRSKAITQVGGATWLASYEASDITLLRLNSSPPVEANPYWLGWYRKDDLMPYYSTVIHHPNGNEKRISFISGEPLLDNTDLQPDLPGLYHWYVQNYYSGSTESGSSGAGLLGYGSNLIGVLSGGSAACGNNEGDYYGRLAPAFEGGGTPSTRLKDWLDPNNDEFATGVIGVKSCAPLDISLTVPASPLLAGNQVTFSASALNGTGTYSFEWDIENDGIIDVTELNLHDGDQSVLTTRFPAPFNGTLSLKVTDQTSCSNSIKQALNVVGSDASVSFNVTNFQPRQLCGNGDTQIDPGEEWQFPVLFTHLNNIEASNDKSVAVFSIAQGANQADAAIEFPATLLPKADGSENILHWINVLVSPTSVCGAPLTINYQGIISNNSFTGNPISFSPSNMGAPGCKPSNCKSSNFELIPHEGNYYDPTQPGSGMTVVMGAKNDPQPVFFGLWFTGDIERYPIWYVVSDRLKGRQVNTSIYKAQFSGNFPVQYVPVGTALISFISKDKFAFTWTMGSKSGGSVMIPVSGEGTVSKLLSWYNPVESGWGVFDEFFPNPSIPLSPERFHLAFLYDAAGQPRWVVAQQSNSDYSYNNVKPLDVTVVRPSCPGCPWLDYLKAPHVIGSISLTPWWMGMNPRISTNINWLYPNGGSWIRTDMPLQPLVESSSSSQVDKKAVTDAGIR